MDQGKLTAVLVDFARTLTRDLSVQMTLDYLTAGVLEALPVSGVGLMLMDAEHHHHHLSATNEMFAEIEALQLELDEGPCLEAFLSGRAVLIPELAKDTDFPRFSPQAIEAGVAAVFSFPLLVGEQGLGALELYSDVPVSLPDDDVEAVVVLADVIAAYLYNARARTASRDSVEVLQVMALHDPLTGLPNRWLLKDRLDQALRKSQRTDHFVAVVFIDVDRLKVINDTFGHEAGDEFLKQLVGRLQDVVRPGDTLARLGGDEFVVVCDDLSATVQAEEVADRMLAVLEDPFLIDGTATQVTVSMGIAFARGDEGCVASALARADAAMYAAKREGGGRRRTDGMALAVR